jgi:hypothetical protein
MTDRTILAVVSDLIKTGLTVEQQVLVNELALFGAGDSASRIYERERKRAYREMSRTVPDKRKEPKENNILNISPLEGVQGKPLSRTNLDAPFEDFWGVYPRKVGKGAARKAYRNALKRASEAEILAGAKVYAASKPEPQYTAHATTWLNADRWLDEPERKPGATVVGFRKEFKPEPECPKISEEERQRNLAKLTNLVSGTLKWNK